MKTEETMKKIKHGELVDRQIIRKEMTLSAGINFGYKRGRINCVIRISSVLNDPVRMQVSKVNTDKYG